MIRYSSTMTEALQEIREGFSSKQIKMAIGIASDKRYAGGNMTGAVNAIEKIKKGLSDHPQVAAVLKRQNEDIQEDGHTDVASAKNQVKVAMTALQKMEMELGKLNDEDTLPSWWTNKVAIAVDKIDGMADYLDTQVEGVKPIQWPSQPLEESVTIDELKMDDPKLNKVFDKLKRGDTVKLKTSSTINQGKDFVEYIVKSKNTVNKGRVEKVTLVTKGNEKAVKKFLYKRDGKVTFAIGDMGASIDDIKEGTWALPDSPKAKAELKKLMSKPIKLGKEGDDASDKLYALIGDDELFDDLYVAGKKNPNGDARDVVKKHMKRLGIKEEVELEEKLKVSDGLGAWIDDFKKSDAPQFAGKSDEEKKNMAIAAFTDAGGKLDEAMANWKVTVVKPVNKLKKGDSVSVKANNIPQALKKSAKAFGDSGLTAAPSTHFDVQKEEVELDEMREPYAVVDTADGNKVVGTASDEKGAKSIISTSQLPPMKIKDKKTLKIVKVKKKQMIGYPIKEEEGEPQKPDSAKAVDQSRDDKKKTRIAQLQLQIAKASETINKLNAQEKPNE